MFLTTGRKLRILLCPYGIGAKEKYSHRRRFKMLRDVEALLKRGALKLTDTDIGKLLDERDRFHMHYYDQLTGKERTQLVALFDFLDDNQYLRYIRVFLSDLSPNDRAIRCPRCRSLILWESDERLPCPRCSFTPDPGRRTFLHCSHNGC